MEATFAGPSIEENWAALFQTTALFRTVASAVADGLGFTYPRDLDRRVMAHLTHIKDLPR